MTILWAQAEASEWGLCRCGQWATSELSYTEEMDQHQDASSPMPPSSPPMDQSYGTPPVESVSQLIPVPEDVQLPCPTLSEVAPIPIPPPHASTLGRVVSGQRCWTRHKVDLAPGTGASGCLFWHFSGLRRITVNPILLDMGRLVEALETGGFKLTNTWVHQNLVLHHLRSSMHFSAILLCEACCMVGSPFCLAILQEISWRDLQWMKVEQRGSPVPVREKVVEDEVTRVVTC